MWYALCKLSEAVKGVFYRLGPSPRVSVKLDCLGKGSVGTWDKPRSKVRVSVVWGIVIP